EGLKKMEIGSVQRELTVLGIAQPGQLLMIRARQIRPQTLSPGTAEDRLQQPGVRARIERCASLDHERANADLAQVGSLQQSDQAREGRQTMLAETVAVTIIGVHRLGESALEPGVPCKVHVG